MLEQQKHAGCGLVLMTAVLLLIAPAAFSQPQQAAIKAVSPAAQNQTGAPMQAGQTTSSESAQTLHVLVGRSLVITSATRIKRVSLADPTIAEAVVVSPTQVLLNGKAPGGVSLIIWDESGQSQAFEVSVDIDIMGLSQKIHEVFPSEPVQIATSGPVVMLSGKVSSPEVADKILDVVKNVAPKVTSFLEVPPIPTGEISLQVKFAEVSRQAIGQYGVNLFRTFGSNMPMATSTQQFSPPSLGSLTTTSTSGSTTTTSTSGQNSFELSNLLNIFIFRPDIDLGATIQALQTQDLLQILAEPNLITQSGKPASFLAGGQFPYPVVQNVGGGTAPAITIQFKEYGIRLNFTPTLTPDGLIHLKVTPEVSSLDFSNALTLQGFLIPALATDRVESEMDLRDGQSFAIAGLLDNRVTKQLSKIPGIGDIPILGKLFQSQTLNKSNNELIIVVTPRIIQPFAAGQGPKGPAFPATFLPPTTPPAQNPAESK
jgi:pilus assembly protein CpaC